MATEEQRKRVQDDLLLRVKRASTLGSDLDDEIRAWNNTHPLDLNFAVKDDGMGWLVTVSRFDPKPPLEEWGLRFGEVAHHLRSVLNTMLTRIAVVEGLEVRKDLQYPIALDIAKWNGKRKGDGEKRRITVFPERIQRVIYATQPFVMARGHKKSPNMDILAVLAWTNNEDKHDIELTGILKAQSAVHSFKPVYVAPEDNFNEVEVRYAYDNSFEVGSILIAADTTPHQVANIDAATIDMTMDVGFLDEDGNVTPVRVELTEFINKTIEIIESVLHVWKHPEFDIHRLSGSSDFQPVAAFGKAGVDAMNGEGTWERDLINSDRGARYLREQQLELARVQNLTKKAGPTD